MRLWRWRERCGMDRDKRERARIEGDREIGGIREGLEDR